MATFRDRPIDIGRRRSKYLSDRFGHELLIARTVAGLTQRQLGKLAGVSPSLVGAIERGERTPGWEVACRLAAASGYEFSIRIYPVHGVGLRDSGHLHLAQAVSAVLHPAWRARIEAPVAPDDHRDQRATDMLLDHPVELATLELESKLVDFQGQLRPAQLKREVIARREERPVRLIIAVPDTPSIRRVLATHADLIRRYLPVPSREIWRALRLGEPIAGDGILLIPKPSHRRPSSALEAARPLRVFTGGHPARGSRARPQRVVW